MKLTNLTYFFIAFIYSIGLMSVTLFLQWGLHEVPCDMCLLQRYGWYGIIIFSIAGIFLNKYKSPIIKWIFFVLFIVFVIWNIVFALLQLNLVYHIFSGLESICTSISFQGKSLEQQLGLLNQAPIVSCEFPSKLFGIILPWWSLFANTIFLVYIIIFNMFIKVRKL